MIFEIHPNLETNKELFRDYLEKTGKNIATSKLAILQLAHQLKQPFSIKDLKEISYENWLSHDAIYRTVKLLEEANVVRRIDIKKTGKANRYVFELINYEKNKSA